jgi:hypothetical protein
MEGLTLYREAQNAWGTAELSASLGFVACAQGDYAQAASWYRESLRLFEQLGMRRGQATCLEGHARVACAQGRMERAARLLGAAAQLRRAIDTPLPPVERPALAEAIGRVCAALGEDEFAITWAEGEAMALGRAIGLAHHGDTACVTPTKPWPRPPMSRPRHRSERIDG